MNNDLFYVLKEERRKFSSNLIDLFYRFGYQSPENSFVILFNQKLFLKFRLFIMLIDIPSKSRKKKKYESNKLNQ